jgi:DNA polymerase-3 subunit beta
LESGFFGVTATDGVKLFNNYIEHEYQGENVSAVLSGKANNVLLSMINGCDDIEVSFSNSNVVVKTEDSRLVSKKIDGRYPNFKTVIPKNHHTIVHTDKNELIDSLSRVTLIANKTNMCVKFTKNENNIVLEANDYEFSRKSVEKCACESDNKEMTIGTHCGNLILALRSIESTNVDILLSENNKPIVFKDELNKNKTIIIMPMMISD